MNQLLASQVSKELRNLANKKTSETLSRFFKTGKGEYGEGDKFLGVKVPQSRAVAVKYSSLSLPEILKLAQSKYHEERFTAVVILVNQFKKSKKLEDRKKLFDFYLKLINNCSVNNWDLIDVSAPYLGEFLIDKQDSLGFLKKLAKSKNLWNQRAAVMLTWAFIREHELEPTFVITEMHLKHPHDLIHKACGWMLREAGKRDLAALRAFLNEHAGTMPRTMLRYAIEKLSEAERKKWLSHSTR
jgi:3-methyladenine DNA glycosylase AlkD